MIPSPPPTRTEVSEEHARNIARIIAGVYSSSNLYEKREKAEKAIDLYWKEIAIRELIDETLEKT